MKMTALMRLVAEQKTARLALVLPVLAQAARRAFTMRAWVNAAVMPLSLKLPDGFMPSYCRNNRPGLTPTNGATTSARWRIVWPSPMVMTFSGGAKGSNSRKRQPREKHGGSVGRDHLAWKSVSERGGGRGSRSYATSISPPQRGQLNDVSARSAVPPQAGSMQHWNTGSLIPSWR